MKILLLGKNGQVGWELQRALAPLGELVCYDRSNGGDLADLSQINLLIQNQQPDVVINAAAYTGVDAAEDEVQQADLINHLAVKTIAEAVNTLGGTLVHFSTDYVYKGDGQQAWLETDSVCPQNQYGHTKLRGEKAIVASGCKHYIFRTSWVYGAVGNNFVKTMLRLAKDRSALSVVSDQIGAPTGAALIADITAITLAKRQITNVPEGVYHLAAAGETSWQQYTQFILDCANEIGLEIKCNSAGVSGVTSAEYPQKATRPKNSRLDLSKIETTLNIKMPHWQHGVAHVIQELSLLKAVN